MTDRALPPLNALLARSTYAIALTVAVPLLHLLGVDLLGMIATLPGPADIAPAVDRIDALVMAATATWAYAERRNPKHSIDWGAAARSVTRLGGLLR